MTSEYTCKKCHGDKVIASPVSVVRICHQCNGKGSTDWISHAMGSDHAFEPPDNQVLHNIAMRNIQQLVSEIERQGLVIGITIGVNVNFHNQRASEMEYMLQPSLVIPKSAKTNVPKIGD